VEAEKAAREFLRTYPGVEAVFTRTQLEQGQLPNTKMAKQVALAWHQQISGDIVIMNKPNWYLFAKPFAYAATHGSPWAYDTNVPLAMYGPNWVKSGKYGDSETVDLGRTIAHPQRAPSQRLRGTGADRGDALTAGPQHSSVICHETEPAPRPQAAGQFLRRIRR
jgi:hypothetical protein